MELAVSTVAMSAYNVLTSAPRKVTFRELYVAVCQGHQTQIDRQSYINAIKGLLMRGWIHLHQAHGEQPEHMVSCRDYHRRLVRWRDRDGDGWNNWLVADPRGPRKLEDAINDTITG